jgi:hypothetical protein
MYNVCIENLNETDKAGESPGEIGRSIYYCWYELCSIIRSEDASDGKIRTGTPK